MCFRTSINKSATIQPLRDDNPRLEVGAPFEYLSLNCTRDKTKTGGRAIPMALTIPQNVTNSPLSAATICPICLKTYICM